MACTAQMFSEDEEDLLRILRRKKPRRSEWLDVEEDLLAMDEEF